MGLNLSVSNPRGDVLQGLLSRGFPRHIAQGILGNFEVESGFNPGINEISPTVPGSRGGFGLAQWTGPRRRELEAFAQSSGGPVGSVDTQLDFLLQELGTTERRAGEALRGTKTAEEAARVFSEQFLRPGTPNIDRRIAASIGEDTMRALGRSPQQNGGPPVANGLLGQQQQPQQPQTLGQRIGGFFGDPDKRAQLAIGLQGLTLNPNQAFIQSLQGGIDQRAGEAQVAREQQDTEERANRTAEWLKGQGFEKLGDAVGGGFLDAGAAVSTALSTPKDQRTSLIKNYDFFLEQGLSPEDSLAAAKSGTVVNVGGPGETEFQKVTGRQRAETAQEIVVQGASAQRNLGTIQTLEKALIAAPSGAAGSLANIAANIGIKLEGSSDIELANALISQLVPQQRPPGSGVMSDADLALFKQSLPRLINSPKGNAKIISTMKAIANYDVARASIAQDIQDGVITHREGSEKYRDLGNPLGDFAKEVEDIGTGDPAPEFDQGLLEFMTPEERALFE